jgi:hypothetical protein
MSKEFPAGEKVLKGAHVLQTHPEVKWTERSARKGLKML